MGRWAQCKLILSLEFPAVRQAMTVVSGLTEFLMQSNLLRSGHKNMATCVRNHTRSTLFPKHGADLASDRNDETHSTSLLSSGQ